MAKKLEYFDFSNPRKSKYPWDQWMDGSVWQCEFSEDFECDPKSFISSLQGKAKRTHRKVQYKLVDETKVVFRFLPVQNGHSKESKRREFLSVGGGDD